MAPRAHWKGTRKATSSALMDALKQSVKGKGTAGGGEIPGAARDEPTSCEESAPLGGKAPAGGVIVIASEAKQSIYAAFGTMDCFVASLLAMTEYH